MHGDALLGGIKEVARANGYRCTPDFYHIFLDFDFEGREINQINRSFMHFSLDKMHSKTVEPSIIKDVFILFII